MSRSRPRLPADTSACLFDLDGVLTSTAELHAAAWKQAFDTLLLDHDDSGSEFDPASDYRDYVDGKPRADGVRSFLASRSLELPEGLPGDPPSARTVQSLAQHKEELFLDLMAKRGVTPYAGSVEFLRTVRGSGIPRAVVTSSENADAVLAAAHLDAEFDAKVDGVVARDLGLPGKPAPDTFLEAARRLGVSVARAAVFEDALAGVAAGRAGGFGFVVGVDRGGAASELRAAGADVVVGDLAELIES